MVLEAVFPTSRAAPKFWYTIQLPSWFFMQVTYMIIFDIIKKKIVILWKIFIL